MKANQTTLKDQMTSRGKGLCVTSVCSGNMKYQNISFLFSCASVIDSERRKLKKFLELKDFIDIPK